MKDYEFTLIFSLSDQNDDPSNYIEALGAAGCTDATIGVGVNGRIALSFCREAKDACEAISSAIKDVLSAIPNAVLSEAAPDFVGLTDIAERVGFSRQNMRKLMEQGGMSFPAPLHQGKTSIWHLANVLTWLRDVKHYAIDTRLLELAAVNMQCNLHRSLNEADSRYQREISRWLEKP